MSDDKMFDNLYEGQSHVIRLRVWALGQMVWGAFLAGAFLAVIGGVLFAVWVVSQMLPEQSKQAPSPYGAIEIVQTVHAV
jgi:hypothetical protein